MIITGLFLNPDESVPAFSVSNFDMCTVVIDPGHGGIDPGKVAVNGVYEKDINLCISKKLKNYLTYAGAQVIMIREEDIGLYDPNSKNKKREDLNNRKKIINNSDADIIVSIHANSFQKEKYKGAQVFYFKDSEQGKELAGIIQKQFKYFVDETNDRQIKQSDSLYILKRTNIPAVIVECGFLSNYKEAELLSTDAYQDKVAWAIYIGICRYLSLQENSSL